MIANPDELNEIARKLDEDYRADIFSESMETIAEEVIGEDVCQAREIMREHGGVEDFYEVLFVATHENIVAVLADELGSMPEDRREAICEAVDWQEVVTKAVRTVALTNLYDAIAHTLRPFLYQAEDELYPSRVTLGEFVPEDFFAGE